MDHERRSRIYQGCKFSTLYAKWEMKREKSGTDKQVENPVDETADQLRSIGQTGTAADNVTKELQKRKLISPK
jgi:hypothetical protein